IPHYIAFEGLDVAFGHCHAKDLVSLFTRATLVPIQKVVNHSRQLIASGRRYHRPQRARRARKISHETGWHNDDKGCLQHPILQILSEHRILAVAERHHWDRCYRLLSSGPLCEQEAEKQS